VVGRVVALVAAAREALQEFDTRQAAADRAAAAEATRHRQSEYDSEHDGEHEAHRHERETHAAQARAACDGSEAEATIAAVRDLAAGSALDDAALAAFLDENG
jgi:hypothetical protein